ncbi:hypothetical protein [Helicobacter labetoulli]|uniref:hypothetical protein n=1 Tax=Helicobacter labetoulli TaxID=2315333 RepID=UPI0039E978F2
MFNCLCKPCFLNASRLILHSSLGSSRAFFTKGLVRTYNIEVEKIDSEWNYPSKIEIENALSLSQSQEYKLPIFAGFDIEKKPFILT